jgi:hypothetical protein
VSAAGHRGHRVRLLEPKGVFHIFWKLQEYMEHNEGDPGFMVSDDHCTPGDDLAARGGALRR